MSLYAVRLGLGIVLLSLAVGGVSTGCGSSPADPTEPDAARSDAAAVDGGVDADTRRYQIDDLEVTWTPCSLYEGADDGRAECASTAMPLFWDEPEGPTTYVVAKRLLATSGGDRQLWLLHGGPGASGVQGFPAKMDQLAGLYPTLDIYTLDHRGTGYSTYLECPDQETSGSLGGASILPEEVAPCAAYLDSQHGAGLAAMSTTQSSIDLAAYIEAAREPGLPVVVWGGSYGTYHAQRFLQIFPDMVDGVILEGVASPEITVISTDEDSNRAGQDLLAVCAQQTACASRLGGDPWAFLDEALEGLRSSTCTEVSMSADNFRLLLVYLAYYYPIHGVIPAAIYRLHRCAPEDGAALSSLLNLMFGPSGTLTNVPYSMVLQYHVNLSEMWSHPDFEGVDLPTYFASVDASALFYRGLSPRKYALLPDWPVYADAEYDDGWPQTSVPMLMLHGELDPATPFFRAQTVGDHYTAANQHFVSFPHGAHGVTRGSPLSTAADTEHCAMQLFGAFLYDPAGPLDTSCVASVLPMDFEGTPENAAAFFGTGDYWELGVPPPPPPRSPTPAPLPKLGSAIQPAPGALSDAIGQVRLRIQRDRALGLIPLRLP